MSCRLLSSRGVVVVGFVHLKLEAWAQSQVGACSSTHSCKFALPQRKFAGNFRKFAVPQGKFAGCGRMSPVKHTSTASIIIIT